MSEGELAKLIKIRDDAKGSFWDFEKWRVMARLDQFIADVQHEHETNAAAYDALKAAGPTRPGGQE